MLKLIACILCSEHLETKILWTEIKACITNKTVFTKRKAAWWSLLKENTGRERETDRKREIVSAPEVMQVLLTKFVYVIWNSKETSSDANSTTNNVYGKNVNIL